MFKLGLTGSIGMGKTTTASIFSALGCDVWDADAAVHRLYAKGGAAVAPMSGVFSQVIEEGGVACVWTTAEVQQERVMQRGTMSMDQFEVIRAKQLPTHEKRDRSDFVIITDTIEHARVQVQNVLTEIRQRMTNA